MPAPKKLLVFLSHASEDKPAVRNLCKRLKADGFDPWLDEERLLPGQEWPLEIEKAMRSSDTILLCFSARSVAKEGFVQREYKRAMQYQEEKPEGTIFVIPVRLGACEMPFFIRELQWVDFPAGYDRLARALNQRAGVIPKLPIPKKKTDEEKKPTRVINEIIVNRYINARIVHQDIELIILSLYITGNHKPSVRVANYSEPIRNMTLIVKTFHWLPRTG